MREAFEKALSENWCDWTTRRVFADWLDEHGEPDLAFAERWMARHQLAPAYRVPYMGSRVVKPWAWYPLKNPLELSAPAHSRLPHAVFVTLIGSPYPIVHKFYRQRAEAERDLAKALRALRRLLETDQ